MTRLTLTRAPSSTAVPVTDGQLLLRTDTGEVEADIGTTRIRLAALEGVDTLPEHPLERVYLCRGVFWAHDGSAWVRLGGRTAGEIQSSGGTVQLSPSDGDFQMLRLTEDTRILPPAWLPRTGDPLELEITGASEHRFTLGTRTIGASARSPDAWLVRFHAGRGGVIRWYLLPLSASPAGYDAFFPNRE